MRKLSRKSINQFVPPLVLMSLLLKVLDNFLTLLSIEVSLEYNREFVRIQRLKGRSQIHTTRYINHMLLLLYGNMVFIFMGKWYGSGSRIYTVESAGIWNHVEFNLHATTR